MKTKTIERDIDAAQYLSEVPRGERGAWGPDLFAWAYDFLEQTGLWKNKPAAVEIECNDRVIRWRDRIRGGDGNVDDAALDEIVASIARAMNPALAVLHLVVAIDRAYAGIRLNRPAVVPSEEAVATLTKEWEERGSLERDVDGLVLRKGSQWSAGSALSHYCGDLCRVSPSLGSKVAVRPHTPMASLGEHLRAQSSTATLTVAFVPTLISGDDLEFSPVDRGREHLFAVSLNDKTQADLAASMPGLVEALEAAGVNLALLPETVASPPVRESLRRALIHNNDRCTAAGALPKLRLAVVGVAGPRSNSAHVFGADGAVLATQPKNNRWKLDEGQIRRYGLTADLGTGDRKEDIVEGDALSFVDDPGFGRIVTLICEDLARGSTAWLLTSAATPTIVASPVCDASLAKKRWAYLAAQRITEEPGSLVFVVNSFALADRALRARSPRTVSSAGIGIVCHPDDWTQSGIVRAKARRGGFEIREVRWMQRWKEDTAQDNNA